MLYSSDRRGSGLRRRLIAGALSAERRIAVAVSAFKDGVPIAAAVLVVAFHAWSFKSFPLPNADEAMESNHAYTLLTRGENVYSLFDGVFPRGFEFMAYSFPNVLRPLYNGALAAAFRLGGVGPWSGRALSSGCAGVTLLLACLLAWRRTRSRGVVLGVLFLLGFNAAFAAGSHEARPEAMLGLFAMASFACLASAGESRAWAGLAGALAVSCAGIHTNGAAVVLASAGALAVLAPRRWPFFLLGCVLAGTGLLWCVRPERFLPGWVVFSGFFSYSPPVERWGWNVFGLAAGELLRWVASSRMTHEPMTPLLSWSLKLECALVLGVWLAGWWRLKDVLGRALLVWIGGLTVFYALFVSYKNPNYLSVFQPFLVLMFALFLHRIADEDGALPWRQVLWRGAAGGAFLALASPFLVVPLLFALYLPVLGRKDRWGLYLHVLAALLPACCLRLYAPDAFRGCLISGGKALGSPAGLGLVGLALTGIVGAVFARRRRGPRTAVPGRVGGRPLLGGSLEGTGRKEDVGGRLSGWLAPSLAGALAILILCYAWDIGSRVRRAEPFDALTAELQRRIPEGTRVLGPQRLWLALWDRPYRDWNALAYAKWLTGNPDVSRQTDSWRPDVLLVDADFRRMFLRDGGLERISSRRLKAEAVIDLGADYGQPIELYRFGD